MLPGGFVAGSEAPGQFDLLLAAEERDAGDLGEVDSQGVPGGRLGFLDIPCLLSDALEGHTPSADGSLEAIMDADAWGRRFAQAWIEARP